MRTPFISFFEFRFPKLASSCSTDFFKRVVSVRFFSFQSPCRKFFVCCLLQTLNVEINYGWELWRKRLIRQWVYQVGKKNAVLSIDTVHADSVYCLDYTSVSAITRSWSDTLQGSTLATVTLSLHRTRTWSRRVPDTGRVQLATSWLSCKSPSIAL